MLPSPLHPPPLVGRDREIALLREHLLAATAGRGSLVLIGGEAGIGKTALAEALCRLAEQESAHVFVGRCYDRSETPPYGPFLDLFRHYGPAHGLPPLPAAFSPWGAMGLTVNQSALFKQMQDFLAVVAAVRPVVLLFDDLHWADQASLDLLRILARSVHTLPLLLLITYRADELTRHHPLRSLLPLLDREAAATRLALRPLPAGDVRALIAARYNLAAAEAARLVVYLDARAEGNALFVTQLLRALEEEEVLAVNERGWELGDLGRRSIPLPLMEVIDARIARLADAVQRLLAVAAVLGQEVPLALWGATADVRDEEILAAVEEATTARLLEATTDGTAVRFVHALIREAAYAGILPPHRRQWHRKAADVLIAVPGVDPDTVAYHLRQASDPRAAAWLAKAGERARAAHAYATAVERMREAVALLDRPEDAALAASLCLQIGYMLRHADRPQAIRYSEEAVRRAGEAGDHVLAGVARSRLGSNYCFDDEFVRGIAALRAGVAELEALPPEAWEHTATPRWYVAALEGDRSSVTDVRSALAYPLAVVGACEAALSLLGGTLDIGAAALTTANRPKLLALCTVAEILGRPDVSKRIYKEVGHITRAEEDWYFLATNAHGFLARTVLRYDADDLSYREEAVREAEEAWARAQTSNLAAAFPVHAVRFPLDFITGAWDAARTSAALMQRFLGGQVANTAAVILGTIAGAQGRSEEARRYVREWLPEGAATEPGARSLVESLMFLHLGGLLALDAGDLDAAREWAEASDRWLAWSGAVRGQSEGQALWAQYHRQAGDMEQAREHTERALADATDPRQPLALLAAHRLLGELATEAGRYDDARAHLDAAFILADACAAPYERALTLLARAELRAATGRRDEALAALDDARVVFARLRAEPPMGRANAVAERLHAAPPPPVPAYPAGLSAREVDVLRQVARGQTNREIAATLFLSERTVQVHVRNILTKTDTVNRTAAAAFARDQHLA